jgi:hypothetical protein
MHLSFTCCWPSPEQSFSGPSPTGLMTIFYTLNFETPPTCRARSLYLYPPGTGWPGYIPRHWAPISSPLRLPGLRCRYWNPPPHGLDHLAESWVLRYDRRLAGQSVWGIRPDLHYCMTFADLLIWGALSDERTGLSFAIATGPRQRSHFRVRVL